MSERRTFVFAAIVGRSILGASASVSAVNVRPPVVDGGDTSNPRARNDLWKNKEARARGLYGSCLDSRVAPATSSIAHLPACLPVPLLFLRRIKGLPCALRIWYIIAGYMIYILLRASRFNLTFCCARGQNFATYILTVFLRQDTTLR